jgi:hypothetical protein
MITLTPMGLDALDSDLAAALRQLCEDVKESWTGEAGEPFMQLSYDEISIETVEELFGYADVALTNSPVGVPCDVEPKSKGREWVLFSLQRFEFFLNGLRTSRNERFDEEIIKELVDLIRFCVHRRLLLGISW